MVYRPRSLSTGWLVKSVCYNGSECSLDVEDKSLYIIMAGKYLESSHLECLGDCSTT
jgi:hypothetical protein